MARSYSTYSRLIAWLKVLLPLVALVLLSTIFLISNRSEPGGNVPLGRESDGGPLREGVRAPYFAGTTERGDAITMTAQAAYPDDGDVLRAENIAASLRLSDGSLITLNSVGAEMRDQNRLVDLTGGVEIDSSTGYHVTTDRLRTALDKVSAESVGPISGSGPAGEFTAGRMTITSDPEDGSVQLLFTDGVKLIYDPQK
ncbi:LPS export ABC transporter periplasmic protein LptC [Aestuariicoccus sp. MJ-SS9]|uniref:LPS export ABC transporter periplasmic protein LptC n=1 Tax=Aestuariicoccus sp. MJ-SS9 TaxID=3079855 RepID=UPI002906C38A|nr:LPS export ABC transporter periplasmic protein LptC [Aestuariicoccus sp. MJ-SS9]MDU8910182.1 LPS export ABC transporter periplasmic protein LptC [Aestuariicoccus sp. MJ-SS9]